MATLVINDLEESMELDQQAMRRITGGSSRPALGVKTWRSDSFRHPLSFEHSKVIDFGFTGFRDK